MKKQNTNVSSELLPGELTYVVSGDMKMKGIALEVSKKISTALANREIPTRHSYLEQVKDAVDGKRAKAITGTQSELEGITQDDMELLTRSAGGNWEQARQ